MAYRQWDQQALAGTEKFEFDNTYGSCRR